MKQKFSSSWKKSTKPRKQRKYRYNAPAHVKQKLVRANLSKDLRKKYNKRSIGIRVEDKVKVMVGDYKGKEGKVERVSLKKLRIHVTGIEKTKKDGSKVSYPLHPSNITITELNLNDKKRQKILDRKNTPKKQEE